MSYDNSILVLCLQLVFTSYGMFLACCFGDGEMLLLLETRIQVQYLRAGGHLKDKTGGYYDFFGLETVSN